VEIARCLRGQYFGELALVTNKPRAASAHAIGTVKCLGRGHSGGPGYVCIPGLPPTWAISLGSQVLRASQSRTGFGLTLTTEIRTPTQRVLYLCSQKNAMCCVSRKKAKMDVSCSLLLSCSASMGWTHPSQVWL